MVLCYHICGCRVVLAADTGVVVGAAVWAAGEALVVLAVGGAGAGERAEIGN